MDWRKRHSTSDAGGARLLNGSQSVHTECETASSWSVHMASFQQISIGIVCLVAAFAFGNYVNNHPPTDPDQVALKSDSESQTGNVQSRLTVAGLDIVEKRPAPIATMRQTLKPRFGVPSSSANNQLPVASNSIALPPPSQLGGAQTQSPLSPIVTNNQTNNAAESGMVQRRIKQNEVPDFSSIIAEFKNSPIALPGNRSSQNALGQIPKHTSPVNNPAAIARTQQQLGAMSDNLVQDQPNFAVAQDSISNKNIASNFQNANPFSDEDFSPRLKDRFSNTIAPVQRISPNRQLPQREVSQNTTAPADGNSNLSLAESFGFTYADPPAPTETNETPYQASPIGSVAGPAELADSSRWNPPPAPTHSTLAPINQPASGQPNVNLQNQPPVESLASNQRSNQVVSRNHIVSRQPLSNDSANNQNQSIFNEPRSVVQESSLARINDGYQPGVARQSVPQQNANQRLAENNRVRTMLPFGLNEHGKKQLVAIKSRTNTMLESDSTKFLDHVIQPGETLQSISKRYFGKPDYYLDIYLANRNKLANPIDTPDGQAIRIPVY